MITVICRIEVEIRADVYERFYDDGEFNLMLDETDAADRCGHGYKYRDNVPCLWADIVGIDNLFVAGDIERALNALVKYFTDKFNEEKDEE